MSTVMSEEELVLLEEYFEAIIDDKINKAFGRDSLNESVRRSNLRNDVLTVLVFGEKLEDEND